MRRVPRGFTTSTGTAPCAGGSVIALTLPFWILQAVAYGACALIFLAASLPIVRWFFGWDDRRRARQQRRRRAGYITDDLIREIRFFDDDPDPRGLIR
jgi:hypothetical protein